MPKTPPFSAAVREATSSLKRTIVDHMECLARQDCKDNDTFGMPKEDPKVRSLLNAVNEARKKLAKLVGKERAAAIAADCINEVQRGDKQENRSI